jgi:hypothetical protein
MFQVCRQSEFGTVEPINVLVSSVRYCNSVSGSTVTSYSYNVSAPQTQRYGEFAGIDKWANVHLLTLCTNFCSQLFDWP